MAAGLLAVGLLAAGCARYNTFYNAEQAFKAAERAREEAIKQGTDVNRAATNQRQNYLRAISKAQKVLEMYPGHSLSDDAVFLQGKAHHRLASYRMSIRQLDLLFTNFPRTPYMEEALFLQAVNYLMINDAARSQDFLDLLERQFPDSRFQAEAMRASGDNAHALKDWNGAVRSYRRYLERHPHGDDWDRSSLQLAEALRELERFEDATEVLQRVIAESLLAERVFKARLLLTRCLVQLGEADTAEAMVAQLKSEAEIHGQQGNVGLVEAEVLLAAGQRQAAMAMLEGLPQDQLARESKPVWADMLGRIYLADEQFEREKLEKARDYLQQAVAGAQFLREPDDSRRLLTTVRDYLAAQNQIADAPPERTARLRLMQANALFFGFQRPAMAYDLYAALAADTTADSTVAPRALYGAMLLQETHFQEPDSAAFYARALLERYPESPQAFKVRSGADFDLLAFLLAQELSAQLAARQASGDREAGTPSLTGPAARFGSGLRRQMIYLQRRPPLVFPPPPAAVQALALRSRQQAQAAAPVPSAQPAATIPAGPAAAPSPMPLDRQKSLSAATLPTDSLTIPPADALAPADSTGALPGEPVAGPQAQPQPEPEPETKPEPEKKPESKRPRRWDL